MTQEELQKAKERLQNAESLKVEIDAIKGRISYFDEILKNAKILRCADVSMLGEKGKDYSVHIDNFMNLDLTKELDSCASKYLAEVQDIYKRKLKKLEEEFKNLSL